MRNRPESGIVRKTAAEIPRASKGDLERLRGALANADLRGGADGGDLRASKSLRIVRDAAGKIVKLPRSQIRTGILRELGNRRMTRYELWKIARRGCPTLTQSAVYEFLRGFRQLGLTYIEALIAALNLRLVGSQFTP